MFIRIDFFAPATLLKFGHYVGEHPVCLFSFQGSGVNFGGLAQQLLGTLDVIAACSLFCRVKTIIKIK